MTKSNNAPIGFFDSGVGGVTVYEQVKKLLPDENYIYFGDTKNMPYGEKTEAELLGFADKIFKFLELKNKLEKLGLFDPARKKPLPQNNYALLYDNPDDPESNW